MELRNTRTIITSIQSNSFNQEAAIAQSVYLDNRVSVPDRTKEFSLLHNVQTRSGPHPISSPMYVAFFQD
jgi:hypothetical protein